MRCEEVFKRLGVADAFRAYAVHTAQETIQICTCSGVRGCVNFKAFGSSDFI